MLTDYGEENHALKQQLTSRGKFRLTINDTTSILGSQKATYRFHSKYRRFALGCKLFLIPLLIIVLFAIIRRITLVYNITSALRYPLFHIPRIEFVEELLPGNHASNVADTFDWSAKEDPYLFVKLEMINRTGFHAYFENTHISLSLTEDGETEELLKVENKNQLLFPSAEFKVAHKIGDKLQSPVSYTNKKNDKEGKEKEMKLKVKFDLILVSMSSRIQKNIEFEARLGLVVKRTANGQNAQRYQKTIWDVEFEKEEIGIGNKFEIGPVRNSSKYAFIKTPLNNSMVDLVMFPNAKVKLSLGDNNKIIELNVHKVFLENRMAGVIVSFNNNNKTPVEKLGSFFNGGARKVKVEIISCDNPTYGKALERIGIFEIDIGV